MSLKLITAKICIDRERETKRGCLFVCLIRRKRGVIPVVYYNLANHSSHRNEKKMDLALVLAN